MEDYGGEFQEFYKAMCEAMSKAHEEKGDSWKYPKKPDSVSMGFLCMKLAQCVEEYRNYGRMKKLVQAANYAAMLWLRRGR